MEHVLIEWIDGCGKPELVGKRVQMGADQATNQIAKGRAMLVEESEPEKPKRKRGTTEETGEAES